MEKFLEILGSIADCRRSAGKRHSLGVVVFLTILAIINGSRGYRAIGDFIKSNSDFLLSHLPLEKPRLPSQSTVRRVMQGIEPSDLNQALQKWEDLSANESSLAVNQAEEVWAVDGKSLRGTLVEGQGSGQNFRSLLSILAVFRGQVIAGRGFENGHSSELTELQNWLLDLDLNQKLLTLDALHCQKKL